MAEQHTAAAQKHLSCRRLNGWVRSLFLHHCLLVFGEATPCYAASVPVDAERGCGGHACRSRPVQNAEAQLVLGLAVRSPTAQTLCIATGQLEGELLVMARLLCVLSTIMGHTRC